MPSGSSRHAVIIKNSGPSHDRHPERSKGFFSPAAERKAENGPPASAEKAPSRRLRSLRITAGAPG